MLLSTTTSILFETFGYEKGIEIAAEVGFDALDMNLIKVIYNDEFSDENYEKTCIMLKEKIKECGMRFNQAHAPFPSVRFCDDPTEEKEYNEKVKPALIRSIKAAGILGADQIVVHPIDCTPRPLMDQKKFNIDFYNSLIPICKEYGIKVALENMWGRIPGTQHIIANVCSYGRDLAEYYDALDPEYFTVCLDIGHSGLVGQNADDAIRELGGKRLTALHVHDTDGVKDLHTMPFKSKVDWKAVMAALSEINYTGDFTYEVGAHHLRDAYRERPELMKEAYRMMVLVGRSLMADMGK